jgi:hypothetical protein
VIVVILIAAIAIGVGAPIVAAFRGASLRTSAVLALVPASLFGVGALVSLETAWGGRSAESSEDVSNTYALFVASLLALFAGVMGFCLAALITRVRGGSEWSRRA